MNNNYLLEINKLCFSYAENQVLQSISLTVRPGETLSLIGPSGYGKSTLLQLIAGDLPPSSGSVTRKGLWRRVFQSDALLPWLSVEENIRMGLRGVDKARSLDFKTITEQLDIGRVLSLYPRQLSGGLRQRAEIARALIGRPDGLLLDEPFSSLDYLIRCEARDYLSTLLKQVPLAMIFVTHDVPEAVSLTQKSYILKGHPATIAGIYENSSMPSQELVENIRRDLKRSEL